jgi:hypothetical protein
MDLTSATVVGVLIVLGIVVLAFLIGENSQSSYHRPSSRDSQPDYSSYEKSGRVSGARQGDNPTFWNESSGE